MKTVGVLGALMCGAMLLGGCGGDNGEANNTLTKTFVGPKTMPIWLMIRQSNEVQNDYTMTVPEGEEAVKNAIVATGGSVRYVTAVGNSRTIYGRTSDERHIVVDVDPARDGKVTIDVCVDMYGNKNESRKILNAIPGTPVGVVATEAATVATTEAPAAPCPAKGCDK